MKWSPQQDAALRSVRRWHASGDEQVFRLFGYAGTGKTTLARQVAEDINGRTLFGAYTGKAAHVLRRMGCPAASTIHSLIYVPKDKSRTRLRELELQLADLRGELGEEGEDVDGNPEVRRLLAELTQERSELSRPTFDLNLESELSSADLLVVDECSMVDARMGQDLLSFGVKVLVLGDPAQLPPTRGAGFFTDHEPDVLLTEIHRQARDNPIIDLATQLREQRLPSPGLYGESVVTRDRVQPDVPLKADQVLCGRNRTRRAINQRMRRLHDILEDLPVAGDKVVCLRNNHELGLLNGSLWTVLQAVEEEDDRIHMQVRSEDGVGADCVDLLAHTAPFLGRDAPFWELRDLNQFDFGYALTVHKAQGSQWGDVVVFDESSCFRHDRWRWLYTGVTRAADRVTLVLGG